MKLSILYKEIKNRHHTLIIFPYIKSVESFLEVDQSILRVFIQSELKQNSFVALYNGALEQFELLLNEKLPTYIKSEENFLWINPVLKNQLKEVQKEDGPIGPESFSKAIHQISSELDDQVQNLKS